MNSEPETANGKDAGLLTRILEESYGPGAWHGADLKAALEGVSDEQAFWRPAPGRHNIAEIALHHAFYAHSVRGRLTGVEPEPFLLQGEDWFPLDGQSFPGWAEVRQTVETQQRLLAELVAGIGAGQVASPRNNGERLDLVLGIACHAIYHAGQVQLIRRLQAGQADG